MKANLNAKVNNIIKWPWTEKSQGHGHRERVAVQEISQRSISMQGIKSVMINATKNELKRRGKSKLSSYLEQKNSRSGSQGKVADQEISPRSIPMQGIKSVMINAAENELKRRG